MRGHARRGKAYAVVVLALALAAALVVAVVAGRGPDWEAIGLVLFGWIPFLQRNLSQVSVNQQGVITGLVVVCLLIALLDYLARWWCGAVASADIPPRRWKFRWTLSLVGGLVVMFAAGLSAIGAARQIGWLLTSQQPLHGWRPDIYGTSRDQLATMNYGFEAYQQYQVAGRPGAASEPDPQVPPLHSWQTALLPYLNIVTDRINFQFAWDHPENAGYFRCAVPPFVNPGFRTVELYDASGFGLSHYAGNRHVLQVETARRLEQISAGRANTILVGEVNTGFRPWGQPGACRDPLIGIGEQPDRFGGPSRTGAGFLMADGAVQFLSQDIDPEVLRALSVPGDSGR